MTSKTALAKLSYAQLLEVRKNVDEAIARRQNEERQELTKQLTSLAKLFGINTIAPATEPAATKRVSANKGKKSQAEIPKSEQAK